MSRTRSTLFAAVVVAGALTLTACGGDESSNGASDAAAASEEVSFKSGTAEQNKADLSTGDFAANAAPAKQAKESGPVIRNWVQLSAGAAGDLDPVVTNAAGFVLYRFDKDAPSQSNCFDQCEKTWPPYVVKPGGKVFIDGINKADVGFIKRDKGFQVTIGKAPVYLFSKDLAPGDTNGQGVGGTWFGVTPDGQKAGTDADAPEPDVEEPAAGSGDSDSDSTASELVKRSVEGFYKYAEDATDSESAVGTVKGTGCQNVPSLGGAISTIGPEDAASGGKPIKLWSGRDCTGESLLLRNGNAADLADMNFDNKTRSIFIGEFKDAS
ncbi:putative lipoprotein with Yx(FWY)xxD motif [Streptomyces sp. 3330]|uniref:hypothetical protein n=1 Tax=Streptomyces sp. 3330 TaxID=2817755 RepID=UPI002856E666|nr:hypothetical protein [Streptomyces sp. 3330]MDR6980875.1 putative lipoprotein with Yx(FWY)xxD motif [Streptomyces sp. 3330]